MPYCRSACPSCYIADPLVPHAVLRIRLFLMPVLTDLTTAGVGVVDAFHAYGRVGRLREKPVELLERTDDFLRALLAEREGLLTVKARNVWGIRKTVH